MARVFTIAPGLENMGGLKTGGQGSIYKGRRIGEIVTAIKILPNPINSENRNDENFVAFENEVSKLKKVNETPNPNVVKILSSGLSETGSFPYIEMEYIEGPDLEELLKSPNDPIFTVQETLKVAEQLANALAHCHKVDVRHGDIKSNNVKFNSYTGNYILLDFGLAMMSDEQRRSTFRNTGAIEFMAPEQNTGQMLFQTDVYSFGVVLFELLAGTVPFPLKDKGESARNEVRLAHMASPVPDVMELRRSALPAGWTDQKKQVEMHVPEWFISLIYKCLEKKPEKRFADGIELYDCVVRQIISKSNNTVQASQIINPEQAKQYLVVNQEELRKQLSEYRQELQKKEVELSNLKTLLAKQQVGLQLGKETAIINEPPKVSSSKVSTTSFVALLFVAIALGVFVMFPFLKKSSSANSTVAPNSKKGIVAKRELNSTSDTTAFTPETGQENKVAEQQPRVNNQGDNVEAGTSADTVTTLQEDQQDQNEKVEAKTGDVQPADKPVDQKNDNNEETTKPVDPAGDNANAAKQSEKPAEENGVSKKYVVVSKAYIYNDADENTKRNQFISQSDNAVVRALNERYGFIYVVITNPGGQVFKGWLRKRDLKPYSTE